jgi:type IV fimbrial biogenesis protein FimT
VLNLRHNQSGFSLVELLVAIVILGILMAVAAPALSSWVQNAQIRATADSIQNGLQLARGEAVRLNSQMRFQLTTSIDNTCALSTTNSNWVVSQLDPTGLCASQPAYTGAAGDPLIVQVRSSAEGSGSSIDAAGQSTITFNGLGRTTDIVAPAKVSIAITNPVGGACMPTGPMKCLNVMVTSAGQIRMCDPSLSQVNNPKGC